MKQKGKNVILDTVSDLQTIVLKGAFETNWPVVGSALVVAVWSTVNYVWCLYQIIFHNLPYRDLLRQQLDKWACVHIYHLALTFKLWKHKHYRAASYQQDLKDNLKNVALPGTGVPLSIFCCHYWVALLFVMLGVPLYCLLGALHTVLDCEIRAYLSARADSSSSPTTLATASATSTVAGGVPVATAIASPTTTSAGGSTVKSKVEQVLVRVAELYTRYLLHPTDWFSLWRLNCSVVALHSHISGSADYEQENKWTFLVDGRRLGVPVSPFMETVDTLVCKHRNIEGGMGVYFFDNAACGGDWILQPKLHNDAWLARMLPANPPLSTMRIVTCSSYPLFTQGTTPAAERTPYGSPTAVDKAQLSVDPNKTSDANETSDSPDSLLQGFDVVSKDSCNSIGISGDNNNEGGESSLESPVVPVSVGGADEAATAIAGMSSSDHIKAMSCVLRLGREGASTDHQSVLFDVDIASSEHSLRAVTPVGTEAVATPSASTPLELGVIKDGYTNSHWYQLGLLQFNMLANILRYGVSSPHLSWLWTGAVEETQQAQLTAHMDVPGQQVSGLVVPNIKQALEIVTE